MIYVRVCDECGGHLRDQRRRWHPWCGPTRPGGFPIPPPPDGEGVSDDDRLERIKVLCMQQLEMAAASGDGHLVAKLAATGHKIMATEADKTTMADIMGGLGAPEPSQAELFAVA